MAYYVRSMHKEDVALVTEIDREAFPTPWPPVNYQHELQNRLAHYFVVDKGGEIVEEARVEPTPQTGFTSRVRQLFNRDRFFSPKLPSSGKQYIVGFAGFWMMADEAHLSNIAVRELYRRQGIGELLLISIIDLAVKLQARIITLEVRVSNTDAQKLYSKYGFTRVGIRHGYYTDNREDGVLMSTENIALNSFQARFQQLKQVYARKWDQPPTRLHNSC